jgi:NADH:ubiquinone oxidoreductase subunit B-like Fe-S oxidoreductase
MAAPTLIGDGADERVDRTQNRIWVLQHGPCWCRSHPTDSSSFDYVRSRRSGADLGDWDQNLLIVSERVIDGSAHLYRQVHSDMPDPKLVIAVPPCPAAGQFWEELPNGWGSVEDVIPVDLWVDECINGFPESLMAAVLAARFAQRGESAQYPDRSVSLGG